MNKKFTLNRQVLYYMIIASFFLFACKKDDAKNDQDGRHDKNNLGSYKGVLVGSSGFIKIDLKATGATAAIVFDNVTYQLSSTEPIPEGKKVTGYILQKDGVKVVIDVNADGSVPQIEVTIPGHDIMAVVYKELSTASVESYTGTFINTDSQSPQYNNNGILNFVMRDDNVIILSRCTGGMCDGETATTLANGKITRTANGFALSISNCDPTDMICNLTFNKTASTYKAIVPVDESVQLVVEVKKEQ